MIPKKVHYCWFGNNEKNHLILECMKSWKRYLPDYEIKEWNEDNFDLNMNSYVKQAYEQNKWAFVSDFVRLYALYKEGGIYLDTDVEITRNLDRFLHHSVFSGFESEEYIPTAVMGAKKEHQWIKDLMSYYDKRNFILEDGSLDLTTNTVVITKFAKEKYNLRFDNRHQVIGDDIHIYPKEYFCLNLKSKDNYAIHHFNGSWLPREMYKNQYYFLDRLLKCKFENEKPIFDYILRNGYKNVALYGLGNVGKLIFEELEINGCLPKVIIDKNYSKDFYRKIKVINHIDDISRTINLDVIIITPVNHINTIYNMLKDKVDTNVIGIDQLLGIQVINS